MSGEVEAWVKRYKLRTWSHSNLGRTRYNLVQRWLDNL